MPAYKTFQLNGKIWAIYQVENGMLFLHMLNPYKLPKSILDQLEEDFIFLIGVTESCECDVEFEAAGFLNLSDDEVRQICEQNP